LHDREKLSMGVTIRALLLTTIPDSTSQKFIVLGTLSRGDATADGRYATVFLDFAPVRNKKCAEGDFEKWYARSEQGKQCLMGHKVSAASPEAVEAQVVLITAPPAQQWYRRRKPTADCYVGDKFQDPVSTEEDCPCTDEDYEW
jgi:hypothetical protein